MRYILITFLILTGSLLSNTGSSDLSISGKVFWSNSGLPAENVEIYIKESLKKVRSDSSGSFTFNDLSQGLYTLIASKDEIVGTPQKIQLKDSKYVNLTLDTMSARFNDIIVEEKKSNKFGISNMLEVDGAGIYAGRKSEALNMSNMTANLSTNNARQVFSKISGINVWENDASGVQLNIGSRGLSPSRVSNFNTRQNGYDIAADALGYPESYYTPPMEALDRIEVVRGAASLQYGTQFGGFLNFKIKDGSHSKQIDVNSRQSLAANNVFNSFNSIGGTYQGMNYYGYIQYKQGNGWRPNSNFEAVNFYFKDKINIAENFSITAEFTRMNYLGKQAGGLTDAMFEENPDQSTRHRNWFSIDWNIIAGIIDYKPSSNVKINSRFYKLDASRNSLGFLGRPDRSDPMQERDLLKGDFNNLGNETRILYNYNLIGNYPSTLLAGFRLYKGDTYQSQGFGSNDNDADFNYLDDKDLLNSYHNPSSNQAVFVENLFRLSENITITPGLRFENIYSGSEGFYTNVMRDLAGNVINRETFNETRSNKRSFVLFGLSAGYEFDKNIETYVNISQNYRAITFNDIRVINPNMRIDPNLKDENGYSGDIGVRGTIGELLYFDANVFYLYYYDKIGAVLREDEKTYIPYVYRTNISDSRSIGAEIFTEVSILDLINNESSSNELNYFVNASITDAFYLNSKEAAFNGNEVENSPPLILRTGLIFKTENFSSSLSYSYTARHFSDATNSTFSPNAITGIIPAYDVVDLSLEYNFGIVKLEGGINNLLDKAYFTRRASGYPGPGIIPAGRQNFYLTVGVSP